MQNICLNGPILCIGGPMDGERIDVSEYCLNRGVFEAITSPPVPIDQAHLPEYQTYKTGYYQLQRFAGDQKQVPYWIFQGLTADQAIEKLFAGYKP